jgi:beta-glucanase (GH16 family)
MTLYVPATDLQNWINAHEVSIPTTPPPVPTALAGTYGGLAFEDTFREATLDTTKWTAGWFPNAQGLSNPVNSAELAGYNSTQAQTSSGGLWLRAINQAMTCPNGAQKAYTSGLISSNGKFQFTYGILEARIATPVDSSGNVQNWPAFWTDGQSWPADGEIDVVEGLGGTPSWHLHTPAGAVGGGNYQRTDANWHVYTLNWRAGNVDFYLDGALVATHTYDRTSPNYIILNYGVGGAGGPVQVPADMWVDYVRVWQ